MKANERTEAEYMLGDCYRSGTGVRRDGALYEGRRAGTCQGYAGELIELVEVG